MRLVTRISIVLATVFLFLTSIGHAAEETPVFEISGFVIDETGVPVETAQVEVFDTVTGEFVTAIRARPDGHYSMFLPAGDYVVHVPPPEAGGLQPDHQHLLVDNALTMDFMLGFLPDIEPAQTGIKSTDQRSAVQSTSLPTIEQVGTHEIFGRVTDQAGEPIEGTIVEIIDPGTNTVWAFTTTEIEGDYSISVEAGTYNIRVIPPAVSGLGSAIALSQMIDDVTEIDFVLVPDGSVILSGVMRDPLSNPLPNQRMEIAPVGTNNWIEQFTDTNGYYSFDLAPGNYQMRWRNYDNTAPNISRDYFLETHWDSTHLLLTESTVIDFVLPFKQVTVRVQDPVGNPVPGVAVHTSEPYNFDLTSGGLWLYGISAYPTHYAPAITDGSGETTLWLFPPDSDRNYTYTFTAIPPVGSPFATTNLDDVVFTDDTSVTITLVEPVAVSGVMRDPLSNPLPNQRMEIAPVGTNNWIEQFTDTNGYYSFDLAPGNYQMRWRNYDNTAPNISRDYFLETHWDSTHLLLTESTVIDFVLPFKQVTVRVQDPVGNPVPGVAVHTSEPYNFDLTSGGLWLYGISAYPTHYAPAITDGSGETTLWLFPPDSDRNYTYTFTAIPPVGSPFATTNLDDVVFTDDTSVTITLVEPVAVSGVMRDPLSNPLPNQRMEIAPVGTNNWIEQFTDTNGYYSFDLAPGNYQMRWRNYDNTAPNISRDYFLETHWDSTHLLLTESTVIDFVLPFKQVTVRVQDPVGNPVPGVAVHTSEPYNFDLTSGGLWLYGISAYPTHYAPAITDGSGETTLWLFPPDSDRNYTYTFTAIPPVGSPFATFNVHDITITDDKTIIIVLQFVHPQPVTLATIVEDPHPNGEYPDPSTVTLSATAAPGYVVDGTYYSLDGETDEFYTGPFEVAGPGGHTIEYWTIDDAGVYETPKWLNFTIITNVPPFADAGGPYTVDEGASIPLNGSASNDPDGDPLTYEWDFDYDGVTFNVDASGSATPTFSAAGLDGPVAVTVAVRVTDDQGASDIADAQVTVNNVAPTATFGAPASVDESVAISLSLIDPFDPSSADTAAGFEYAFDCGTGYGTFGGSSSTLCSTIDDEVRAVGGKIRDKDGGETAYTAAVTVNNVAPVIDSVTGDTIDEDGTATVSGTFYDVGIADWFTVTIDWGEGAPEDFEYAAGSTGFTQTHQYLDDNPTATPLDTNNITVTVTDDDSGSAIDVSADVTVNNLAPEVGVIAVDYDLVSIGTTITASASFTDTGTADTHTATWNWGDGSSTGTVTPAPSGGSVQDVHTYDVPGVYTIELTVTDDDTDNDSVIYQYVVVYDPTGSFVTGGGTIESPAGAYVPDLSLTGMANFGFVSKYKKGATVPTGHTEFQFHAAGLDFKSTDYQWLVVAGARAQFKGTGTIKDVDGSYGFFLTAIDGEINGGGGSDKFRIKIWDASDDSIMIYDNQIGATDDADPTTVIANGSIVIHKERKK